MDVAIDEAGQQRARALVDDAVAGAFDKAMLDPLYAFAGNEDGRWPAHPSVAGIEEPPRLYRNLLGEGWCGNEGEEGS